MRLVGTEWHASGREQMQHGHGQGQRERGAPRPECPQAGSAGFDHVRRLRATGLCSFTGAAWRRMRRFSISTATENAMAK